jgi:hypothetical protein
MFAMLRIAVMDYWREDDEPLELAGKCQDLAGAFRDRLADCLILADYLQPQEFLIEALSLHMYGEYVSSRDAKSSVWVLNGLVVRLAMRMGYHQPLQPGLSTTPFHASSVPIPETARCANAVDRPKCAKGCGRLFARLIF